MGASIRLRQKQGKALSLYLHAADELTVEQVDENVLALRQEGKLKPTKVAHDVHFPANEYGYSSYQSKKAETGELTCTAVMLRFS